MIDLCTFHNFSLKSIGDTLWIVDHYILFLRQQCYVLCTNIYKADQYF